MAGMAAATVGRQAGMNTTEAAEAAGLAAGAVGAHYNLSLQALKL